MSTVFEEKTFALDELELDESFALSGGKGPDEDEEWDDEEFEDDENWDDEVWEDDEDWEDDDLEEDDEEDE
jgi:hypothetical protein